LFSGYEQLHDTFQKFKVKAHVAKILVDDGAEIMEQQRLAAERKAIGAPPQDPFLTDFLRGSRLPSKAEVRALGS
jgi:hypothetical protein